MTLGIALQLVIVICVALILFKLVTNNSDGLKKTEHGKINVKRIQYFLLFLFFIANSAYRLGKGFDLIFVRVSFAFLLISLIIGKKIRISKIMIWNLLFWGFSYLSILWAINVSDSLSLVNLSIQIVGVIIVISNIVENKADIDTILKMFMFSGVYSMVLLAIRTPISVYGTERIGEVIGLNPNTFGLIMSLSAIISLYYFNIKKDYNKKIYRVLYVIVLVLFSTFSLLLISGIFSLETFSYVKSKKINGLAAICIFIPMILYLIFNNSTLYSVLGYRLEKTYLTMTNQNSSSTVDNSYVERDFYKEKAMELFKEHPLFGVGINNFASHMRNINYSHVAYSHNNYTEILATLGISGFFIYYIFYIYLLVKMIKLLRKDEPEYNKTLLLVIILIMFLFLDYGMVSYREIVYAVFLAIVDSYIRVKDKEEKN